MELNEVVVTKAIIERFTRKLEEMAGRIDRKTMSALMNQRNPVGSLEYLYDTLL